MDIVKLLEEEHSKTATLKIVAYVGKDKLRFNELLSVFLTNNKLLSQRAAWALGDIGFLNPEIAKPHFKILIQTLQEPNKHPGIYRNILRIFQNADIPEKYQAALLDCCLKFITNPQYPEAIRAFSITVASNICAHYVELKNELILVLHEVQAMPQKPAVTFRVKQALNQLTKI